MRVPETLSSHKMDGIIHQKGGAQEQRCGMVICLSMSHGGHYPVYIVTLVHALELVKQNSEDSDEEYALQCLVST